MGLFDFLKPGRKKKEESQDGPSADYVMAHYALRQLALSEPLKFLAIAVSPDAGPFLKSVVKDVSQECGRPTTYSAQSIRIHPVQVSTFPCVVLEFPEPIRLCWHTRLEHRRHSWSGFCILRIL